MSVIERFWAKVDQSGDCWEWTAARDKDGYGVFWARKQNVRAHRFAAALRYGMFDQRLYVLHACDNPSCVRPEHLSLGTILDNKRDEIERGRNWQLRKTHCQNGHEFTPENTYRRANGSRVCQACRHAYRRSYYERTRP